MNQSDVDNSLSPALGRDLGYVFVLLDLNEPGFLTIGVSRNDPSNSMDRIAANHVLAYQEYFPWASKAKSAVLESLETDGFQVSPDGASLTAPLHEVVRALSDECKAQHDNEKRIERLAGATGQGDTVTSAIPLDDFLAGLDMPEKEPWAEFLDEADAHYFGLGGKLKDYGEAMRLYQHAAGLGSLKAYRKLGKMHEDGDGCRPDTTKALECFKHGAAGGNLACYAELALLFEEAGHVEKAVSCWERYFDPEKFLKGSDDRGLLVSAYLDACRRRNASVDHALLLSHVKNEVLDYLRNGLDYTNRNGGDPYMVSRWIERLGFARMAIPDR